LLARNANLSHGLVLRLLSLQEERASYSVVS